MGMVVKHLDGCIVDLLHELKIATHSQGVQSSSQGSDAMRLEDLPTFKKAWDSKGGFSAFQQHVRSLLTDI
ncbi:hypothetical protein Cha6605_2549 [Chamaesiphon minutus PCC 6605]|uniref:Uncharacterized protein n=1 Tax=Chamaesiphon minutus (strain ATCC 27169 / PCC 6605) TaxID=1173020 RepID=K9UHB0_CHAP6|nr:hypothetical protein Cha6605_2549 [Chamaesiphon minutus PCC 6605]